MLSPWTIAAWAVLIVLAGVGVWLLLAYTGGDADANRVQLDAIRTAGTIVVGTGGAAALLLAARRQRTAEIALKQKDREQALQERVATTTAADAEVRRITDLYTKAIEQLGSDKAPVRFGGLYALERLAHENVEQRQTIVNVLCAYLRMPYTLPGDTADDEISTPYRERVQEREVRLAAQRIITRHLRPGLDPDKPVATFWADIDLDLTGATLINVDLGLCMTRDANFTQATFSGTAWFAGTTFDGDVSFGGATFSRGARFSGATFTGDTWFGEATFVSDTWFVEANFSGNTWFTEANFTSDANFRRAIFTRGAHFDHVRLPSTRYTGPNTPSPWTDFSGAQFEWDDPPEVARFTASPDEETGDSGNPPQTGF